MIDTKPSAAALRAHDSAAFASQLRRHSAITPEQRACHMLCYAAFLRLFLPPRLPDDCAVYTLHPFHFAGARAKDSIRATLPAPPFCRYATAAHTVAQPACNRHHIVRRRRQPRHRPPLTPLRHADARHISLAILTPRLSPSREKAPLYIFAPTFCCALMIVDGAVKESLSRTE